MAEQEQGSIDQIESVQLPGPSTPEPFLIGNEYAKPSTEAGSQVPGLTAELPTMDGTQDMGSLGYDGGAPRTGNDVAMQGLTSDGSPLFNDGEHSIGGGGNGGVDSMRGLASGQQSIEVLANEQMYGSQTVPGFSPLPETANPLVGGGEVQ